MASGAKRENRHAAGPLRWLSPAWLDILLLLAILSIGPSFYLPHLGFYTDDWSFLADMRQSADQSIGGLYAALTSVSNVADRPLQALLYIIYDKIAPGSAIVPHVVNQLMFLAAMVILYAGLRRIAALRGNAYHLVLVYTCLPNYFTARLWYANHQSILSLLFFAIALHLIVTLRHKRGWACLPWLAMLFVCTLGNMLAYEVLGVVLLATPFLVACAEGPRVRALVTDRAMILSTVAILASLVAASIFKMHVAKDLFPPMSAGEHLSRALQLYREMVHTNLWTLGIKAPRLAWRIAGGPFLDPRAIYAAAIALALMATGELLRAKRGEADASGDAKPWFLLLSGTAIFVLGYVPFLMNFLYGDSPFGIDNRGNVAAALGISLMAVGAARWCWVFRGWIARAGIVAYCATGIFLQVIVGQAWGRSWTIEQQIYTRLLGAVPRLAPKQTLLLYGFCPYYGPAPIYTESWGLADRLRVDWGRRTVNADTITQYSETRPNGLMVMDDWMTGPVTSYAGMRIYNVSTGTLTAIENARDAQAFFARYPISRATGCEFGDYDGVSLYWQ